ncbi:MAG: hypothetical protein ACYTAO_18475, partial [Planctomycetota bacterium]
SFKSEFPFTAPCSPSSQGYYGTVSAYFSWLYNVNGGGVAAADIVHEVGHTYRLNHAFSISSMTDRWHPYGNWNDVMGMHRGIVKSCGSDPYDQAASFRPFALSRSF